MKNNKLSFITWIISIAITVVTTYFITKLGVIPESMHMLLYIAVAVLALVLLVLACIKKIAKLSIIINILVSIAMIVSYFVVGKIQDNRDNTFSEPAKTQTTTVNIYVMSSEYRSNHTSLFEEQTPSFDLTTYSSKSIGIQDQYDQDNQATAIEELQTLLGTTELNLTHEDTVLSSLEALYQGKIDALILNSAFIPSAKTISDFKNIDTDTTILYSFQIGDEVEQQQTTTTLEPFVTYIAGSDSRSSSLSLVGRTDVDMIMACNPNTKQILLVSIPRDFYINNPALNGMDKLTHLGNSGIQNTLDGINATFNTSINSYLVTNFAHLVSLVDTIGGIDINNPYYFSTVGSNGSSVQVDGESLGDGYEFQEGNIHLDGNMALSYARERYSLSNGDYGRNEHQGIVMQGILEKVSKIASEGNKSTVVSALANDFLTNMNIDNIYNLYSSTASGESYEYIKYHLGGTGTYDGTISMGMDRELYVCKPFDSQIQFTTEIINKLLNNETLTQDPLPDNDLTTYAEN